MGQTPLPRPSPSRRRVLRTAILLLGALVVGGFVIATPLMRVFLVESFKTPAGSMVPTLEVGDQFFVFKTSANRVAERGRVMVFTVPLENAETYVKRVVALGGDEVEVRGGALLINGQPVPRRLVKEATSFDDHDSHVGKWYPFQAAVYEEELGDYVYRVLQDEDPAQRFPDFGPITVPSGHVFCMGDNRDHSFDSRAWGPVPKENLLGTASKIWFSWGPDGPRTERLGKPVNRKRQQR